MRHYGMLFVAVMLAIPIYYIVQIISAYLPPSLSNTTVAAFFIVSLYLTFYFVLRR